MRALLPLLSILAVLLATACSGAEDEPPATECSGPAPNEYSAVIEAIGLDAFEGTRVHLLTEIGLASGGRCRAEGLTEVASGGFDGTLTGRTDDAVYPIYAVFIDVDQDGTCDRSTDLTWTTNGTIIQQQAGYYALAFPDSFAGGDGPDPCDAFR